MSLWRRCQASGRWITGGNIGRGLVCKTRHGTVRTFGSGDNFRWEPLEHSNGVVTDHIDINSFWMAPWDAGGTLGDTVFHVSFTGIIFSEFNEFPENR